MPDPDLAQHAASGEPALRTPTWGLGDAAVGFLLSLVGAVLAASLVVAISGVDEPDDLSLGWTNVAQIGLWVPLVGVTLWAAWTKGNGPVRDFGLRVQGWDVLGTLAGFGTQLILLPLIYVPIFWLTNTNTDDLSETARDLTDRADGAFSVTMLVILTGIGAPIVEEIFYRGLLLRSLERRFGEVTAIVGSGVFFGVIHFQLLAIPGLAVFGMVLALLTVRTGRLGPAIAAHMAFNMVTVISLLADN